MRVSLKAGLVFLSMLTMPVAANAGTLEGVGIGAGTGAVIAGPPGAVVGGVIGAVVGGPNLISRRRHHDRDERHCWHNRNGERHCSWR